MNWTTEAAVTELRNLAAESDQIRQRYPESEFADWRTRVFVAVEGIFENGSLFFRQLTALKWGEPKPRVGYQYRDESHAYMIRCSEDIMTAKGILLAAARSLEEGTVSLRHPEFQRVSQGSRPPKVFLIHGHDDANLLRLQRLLSTRWKIPPVVLREEAGRGRTLIEKFEQEAEEATFAIALLTPDDMVQMAERNYLQPRPNVVFELGWFCGRLGRDNTLILF
jgi:hypothetical protein